MPVWDPKIPVECDECHVQQYFDMTSLGGGCWDIRGLHGQLRRAGWQHHGQIFLCVDCALPDEDATQESRP
jgi:hypothetical protein